jgi:hypothetical protein
LAGQPSSLLIGKSVSSHPDRFFLQVVGLILSTKSLFQEVGHTQVIIADTNVSHFISLWFAKGCVARYSFSQLSGIVPQGPCLLFQSAHCPIENCALSCLLLADPE